MNGIASTEEQLVEEPKRPALVTAIGVFELAAAVLILLVTISQWSGRKFVPQSLTQVVTLSAVYFYIPCDDSAAATQMHAVYHPYCWTDPSEERTEEILDAAFSLPVAAWAAYLGFGLLSMKRSARASAIAWSGITVLMWLRGLLISWGLRGLGTRYVPSAQTRTNAIAGLVLNAFIVLYLLYGNGVARAFGDKE